MSRRFRLFLAPLAALLGLAAACAPIVEPAGPAIGAPEMNGVAFVMADGDTLALQSWLPEGDPDAVLLALHGFNDYANAFDAPAQTLAQHGIATFAYDQRGFGHDDQAGLWAGEETLVADAIAAADLVRARYPGKPLFLMGESMGGAVAILAAAHDPPVAVDGLILVAPAVWARETMPVSYRVSLWLGARLAPSMTVRGSNLDIWPSDNIEMLRALAADPLVIKQTRVDAVYGLVNLMDAALAAAPDVHVPTLLLYGANDQIVPAEPVGMFVADLAPRHRVAVYDSGYHMLLRDLEAEVVVDDIATWIGEPDGALPSGAESSAAAFFIPPPDEPKLARPEALYAIQRRPS